MKNFLAAFLHFTTKENLVYKKEILIIKIDST